MTQDSNISTINDKIDREEQQLDSLIASSGETVVFREFLGDKLGSFVWLNDKILRKREVVAKGCYMANESCEALAKYLNNPKCSIERLALEWNSLGSFEYGFDKLCEALSMNKTLVSIDLRNNNIGEKCGRAFAEKALRGNRSLRNVDLRFNEISDGYIFVELLRSNVNTSLQTLFLKGNNISNELLAEIDRLLNTKDEQRHVYETPVALGDDMHITRGMCEDLEQELLSKRNQIAENTSKCARFSATIDSLNFELQESASKIACLEVKFKVEEEQKKNIQCKLFREKQAFEKIQSDILAANSARDHAEELLKISKNENCERRESFRNRESDLLAALKNCEHELSSTRIREDKLKATLADAEQRAEGNLVKEKQAVKQLNFHIDDSSRKMEEAKQNLHAMKQDFKDCLQNTEGRANQAEKDLASLTDAHRKLENDLTKLRMEKEKQLTDQQAKYVNEFHKFKEHEINDMINTLDSLKIQRRFQDESLEALADELRSTRESRDVEAKSAQSTIIKINEDLQESLQVLKIEREKVRDLNLEINISNGLLKSLQKKIVTLEADRIKATEDRRKEVENIQAQLIMETEDKLKKVEASSRDLNSMKALLEQEKSRFMKEFFMLEKGLHASITAIFSERRNQSKLGEEYDAKFSI